MKKGIVISTLAVLVVVLIGRACVAHSKVLGNMSGCIDEPVTNVSEIIFSGQENEKIKFSFKSNVEAGELGIVLYDSNGLIVYELDKARTLETYCTLEKTDTYTLSAEYNDFVGNYKVVVYEAD